MKSSWITITIIMILAGCTPKHNNEAPKTSTKFCIPDNLMHQITIDTVAIKPVVQEFNLVGKVTFDQDKVVKLYPMVSGNVMDVKVALGDYVKKGEVLAVVRSTEIAGVENDIVSARANLAVSEKNLAANEDMFKSGLISAKENVAAVKETEKARSELKRATTVLSIYGGSHANYIVKSPISGFIVEKFVNPNMQIRPDNTSNLFTISDLKRVWILANVYESDIANIKVGEKVKITTISYPDRQFEGQIDKIYNVLDPDNKTMKVRIQLDNKENLLKPEMFAKVVASQIKDTAMLAVPVKCIVFDRNKHWVIIYHDKCNVQTREVDITRTTSKYAYIRSGVKPGEKVISNMQLLIYNALDQ
ncbi:MAG: efflux RND transporter periplasmic adaptor subunit [Bacteroidetes bacterium]|nr:efflux RND transporter periplasmic adaptor subunit [Bacteroidota bacterium]